MKKTSRCLSFSLWLLIFFVPTAAQEYRTVRDGVEYAEATRQIGGKPVRMNLLRLDLAKVRLDVVHAMDAAIGLERTSSMATRHGALAAINAGFFRLDTSIFAGDAVGALAVDRELLSESYAGRVALLVDNRLTRTEVAIERINAANVVEIAGRTFEAGRNRERKENDLVVYTASFNRTTLTGSDGIEYFIENDRIVKVVDERGSNVIPSSGYIVSASGKIRDELKALLKPFLNRVKVSVRLSPVDGAAASGLLERAEDIVGGVPQLVKNGRVEVSWEAEKSSKAFVETRHPRTAVAKLKDGKFLLVTVDGRSEESAGLALEDLAKLLLEFGAVEAMNLDGGGSTTMFLDGKVVNKPSDKEGERRVSDALLVFPRSR